MNLVFWLNYIGRSLRRGGRRTAFALICIAVGVGGVVALQTASLTVQNALTSNVRAANGGDISVTTDATPLSRSDLKVFGALQRTGRITQWSAVSSLHGTAVTTAGQLIPFDVQVVDRNYPVGGQPSFVSPSNGNVGQLLSRPGNVLITSVLADELGAHVGSHEFVTGVGGNGLHVVVTGILAETSFQHASVMTVTRRDAGHLSNRTPHFTAVYLNVRGPVNPVASILRNQFPVANVQTVQDALQSSQQQVHDFRQFLLLVGLLALLIAGIGILNAIQSILNWRRLEIAMLKALGFGSATLFALFGGEAIGLGIIGGVLGTALGVGVSQVITDALARAMAIQVTYQLDGLTLLAGVALGVGSTLIFALLPIVRATSFRPLEILREGAGVSRVRGWPQTLLLLVIVLALFGALGAVIVGDNTVALQFVGAVAIACTVLTGGFAAVVGWLGRLGPPHSRIRGLVMLLVLAVLTVLAARRIPSIAAILALATLVWAAMVLLPSRGQFPLLMAARGLSRRQARTAVTLVAFLAGVLAMTITLTTALSLQRQISDTLNSVSKVNLVAIGGSAQGPTLRRLSRQLPGIKTRSLSTLITTNPVKINGQPLNQVAGPLQYGGDSGDAADERARLFGEVSGFNLTSGDIPANITIVSGRTLGPGDAGTNHIVARRGLMDPPFSLRAGDTIELRESGTGRTATLQLVGFYTISRAARGFGAFFVAPILSDRAIAQRMGGADAQTVLALSVDSSHVSHDAVQLQHALPGAFVLNIGDLLAVVETILGELLNLLAVITALVLGAGLAVVANGVALAMFDRRREVALFKAIGFGPRSVLSFVLIENSLVGMLAGAVAVLVTALALGIISRLAFQRAIGFDPLVAVVALVLATVLAVGTAYLVARTPIRIRPLEALRNE